MGTSHIQRALDRAIAVLMSAVKSHKNATRKDRQAHIHFRILEDGAIPIFYELRTANAGFTAATGWIPIDWSMQGDLFVMLRVFQLIGSLDVPLVGPNPLLPLFPGPHRQRSEKFILDLMFYLSDDELRRSSITPADSSKRVEFVLSEWIPRSVLLTDKGRVEMARHTF